MMIIGSMCRDVCLPGNCKSGVGKEGKAEWLLNGYRVSIPCDKMSWNSPGLKDKH